MAKSTGRDAASMTPKLIPDAELLPRDDSGGPDFQPYTAEFGDGGTITGGAKAHLSPRGGSEDKFDGTEQVSTIKARTSNPARKPARKGK